MQLGLVEGQDIYVPVNPTEDRVCSLAHLTPLDAPGAQRQQWSPVSPFAQRVLGARLGKGLGPCQL